MSKAYEKKLSKAYEKVYNKREAKDEQKASVFEGHRVDYIPEYADSKW